MLSAVPVVHFHFVSLCAFSKSCFPALWAVVLGVPQIFKTMLSFFPTGLPVVPQTAEADFPLRPLSCPSLCGRAPGSTLHSHPPVRLTRSCGSSLCPGLCETSPDHTMPCWKLAFPCFTSYLLFTLNFCHLIAFISVYQVPLWNWWYCSFFTCKNGSFTWFYLIK